VVSCWRRPRTFAFAVECSATQGLAKRRCYVLAYSCIRGLENSPMHRSRTRRNKRHCAADPKRDRGKVPKLDSRWKSWDEPDRLAVAVPRHARPSQIGTIADLWICRTQSLGGHRTPRTTVSACSRACQAGSERLRQLFAIAFGEAEWPQVAIFETAFNATEVSSIFGPLGRSSGRIHGASMW
jgi:hypothetical protein